MPVKKNETEKRFNDLKWLVGKARNCIDNNYFGDLKITFHRGAITQIEFRSTEVPPSREEQRSPASS